MLVAATAYAGSDDQGRDTGWRSLALRDTGWRSLALRVPITTILADFEDDSVAANLDELRNVLPTECSAQRRAVPARGRFALALSVGATAPNVSVECDLRLRDPLRFPHADRVGVFYWLNEGELQLTFRLRDARGEVFETPLETLRTYHQWVRVSAELDPAKLRPLGAGGPLTWPIEVHGCRVVTNRLGKQTLYLDDFHVEHRVERRDMIRGEFLFDEPTRIYQPGATVGAKLELENCSRAENLRLSVELAWTRPEGSVLKTEHATLTLPASGRDFRSRQPVDFSQRVDQPGLYRLVARARADNWTAAHTFATSIAVTPSNRLLPRGRSTFFGLRTDLFGEPPADQRLENAIARDIGVHLVAIETPWEALEPAVGKLDFAALDPIIDSLVQNAASPIAPLIVLTGSPRAALTGSSRLARLGNVLTQLVEHYGPKVSHYQFGSDAFGDSDWAATAATLQQLQGRVRSVRPEVQLVSPPVPVDVHNSAGITPALLKSSAGVQWSFRTEGDCTVALETLRQFEQKSGIAWQGSHWWQHDAEPLVGATYFADAEAVLRYHVRAALAGVRGVIWYDLRDNDNDPSQPEALRGLVRRDFSPKASLLGYASAAGMLTGLGCRGPVDGTPPEFESALFIGSDRQVAVLLPKPNRIYPALLAPVQGVPGELETRDLERRPCAMLGAADAPLVLTRVRPTFVTLKLESSEPEPQIAFVKTWLRAPATVFCAPGEPFNVEIDAPAEGQRGWLQLGLPPDAPLLATPTQTSFETSAWQTATVPIRISPAAGKTFERSELTLKVTTSRRAVELPIEVRPMVEIEPMPPVAAGTQADLASARYRIGDLEAPADRRASASGTVFAAYDQEELHVTIVVKDDRFVPEIVAPDGSASGDDLVIGAAAENADALIEARVDTSGRPAALRAAYGTPAERLAGCRCILIPETHGDERTYQFTIPAESLGLERFEPGARLRLAGRYLDDDADGLPAVPLRWGQGLDGSRSAEGYRWARLKKTPGS